MISSDEINMIVKGRRAKPPRPAPEGKPFAAAGAPPAAAADSTPPGEPEPAKA